MAIKFEDRYYDVSISDEVKGRIEKFISSNFTGDYDAIINDFDRNPEFEDFYQDLISIANSHRKYSQIIDRVVISGIISAEMIDGKLGDEKTVGITFGVNVAEPDDFLAILSVYF